MVLDEARRLSIEAEDKEKTTCLLLLFSLRLWIIKIQTIVSYDQSVRLLHHPDRNIVLVIDFNDMSALSGTPSSSNRGSRGQGGYRGFGAHHIIPGPPQQNYRGQSTPPYRGRGRGRGGYTPIPVVIAPPPSTPPRSKQQQNGHTKHPLFRGRGGGLGFILSPERPGPKNWDLATRPLLKPIKFIRAKERLFEADPEELLQAHKIPPHPSTLDFCVH